MFSKKATKIDKIFTVNLTITTYCQLDGEDFVIFFGLLRKYELYLEKEKMSGENMTIEIFPTQIAIISV